MIGLTSREVYSSKFDKTVKNNKFELYSFSESKSGGVSYEKVRYDIERDFEITDITPTDLQDGIIKPLVLDEYRKQVTKRMRDDKNMKNLAGYTRSNFHDFESYLKTEVDLVEDDNRLVLDKYNSSFITHELQPGIYTLKDISEVLFNILQPKYPGSSNVIAIEFDEISMKTKLDVTNGIIDIRLEEKSFFSTIFGFISYWDYKQYNDYISQKVVNPNTTNTIHLKCDVIDCSVVNGIREPILFTFVLDKPEGYEVLCEPKTIHHNKKTKKSVLKTIKVYL